MADHVLADARIELKDGLTQTVINQLLDDLRKERVFNKEEAESILEENLSRADKACSLIDSVTKKGPTASEIMLAKLKINDKQLYSKLQLDELLRSASGGSAPRPSLAKLFKKSVFFSRFFSDKGSDLKEYTMTSKPRGFCLIINNMEFVDPKRDLPGYKYDEAALKKVFLGFDVRCYYNRTAEEMKKLMLEYSKEKGHGDCFVCCVLSHGGTDYVDGVDLNPCPMKDILSPFDGKNCPSLVGKPKVFIIQACRGSERDEIVEVSEDNVVGATNSDVPKVSYTIPKSSDFLVSMSTVQGFVSFVRCSGSWFIQALCKHLEEGSRRCEDILTILTRVNDEVSRMEGIVEEKKEYYDEVSGKKQTVTEYYDGKMTPQPCFTLRKKLIFRIP